MLTHYLYQCGYLSESRVRHAWCVWYQVKHKQIIKKIQLELWHLQQIINLINNSCKHILYTFRNKMLILLYTRSKWIMALGLCNWMCVVSNRFLCTYIYTKSHSHFIGIILWAPAHMTHWHPSNESSRCTSEHIALLGSDCKRECVQYKTRRSASSQFCDKSMHIICVQIDCVYRL